MLVTSEEQLQGVVAELVRCPAVGLDLETTGLQPADGDRLVLVGLYHPNIGTFSVPFRMGGFVTNLSEKAIKLFQPLIDNCEIVGHNVGPFDLNFFRAEGMDIEYASVWDTLFGAILWNDSLPRFGLRRLMIDEVGDKSAEDYAFVIKNVYDIPSDVLIARVESDTDLAWRLRDFLEPKILERGDPYPELLRNDMRWALFLGDLGWEGIGFDSDLAERILQHARRRTYEIEQEMWARWRPGLKLNSPKQLLKFFQGRHNITLPNTEDWVMRMAAKGKPEAEEDVERVLEYRKWDKEIHTWLELWLRSAKRGGGRVHGGWGLDASAHAGRESGLTRTLRLRCSKPNLQAVPKDDFTPYHHLKCVFQAEEDNELVGYDDSQAEVRFAAHYAREERMLEVLRDPDGDIHQLVANDLKIKRYPAKRINLGSQYGIGRAALAEELTKELLEPVREEDTERWLRRYHGQYPRLRAVNRRAERVIQERGYLYLWNGRRAHFNPALDQPHKAFNLLVQMGVAELLKAQIFALQDFCAERGLKTKIVLCVYDEIITEVPPEEMQFIPDIKRILEGIGEWRCPLIVDTWHRKRWSDVLPEGI